MNDHIFQITRSQAITLRRHESIYKISQHLVYAVVPVESTQYSDYVMGRAVVEWDIDTKFYTTAGYINNIPKRK